MAALHGSCHCRAVDVTFEPSVPVEKLPLRSCDCSFCQRFGAKYTSDAQGQMRLRFAEQAIIRYRFETEGFDALICRTCGSYVGGIMETPEGLFGVLNVVGAGIAALAALPATAYTPSNDGKAERQDARRQRWTPTRIES